MPVIQKVPSKGIKPVFGFANGSRLPKKQAQKIGERLVSLGGSLEKVTPEQILEDARSPKSPLHKLIYHVDEKTAAHEYYLERARTIIRSLVCYYLDKKGNKTVTRAWHNLIDADNRHVYVPSTFVWRNDGASQQVIDRAKQELNSWVSRYESYKALRDAVKQTKLALLVIK